MQDRACPGKPISVGFDRDIAPVKMVIEARYTIKAISYFPVLNSSAIYFYLETTIEAQVGVRSLSPYMLTPERMQK